MLFKLLSQWESLCDQICGSFKREEASVDKQVIQFGLGAVRVIVMAQIVFCLTIASFDKLDSLRACQMKMRAYIFDTSGEWGKDVHMHDAWQATQQKL